MKKFLITVLLSAFICPYVLANEVVEDYFDMASSYCVQGNYHEASAYLDKILLIEPTNRKALDLRNGLRQIMQGNSSSFILPKSNAVKQSVNAKKQGNKQGELNALNSANDYWGNYFLAEYYMQDKNYSQAINYFVKAVSSKPNFTQCYLEIAICYFEMKNYNQTITYINQYLKANPDDDFAYALRARANANLNNNGAALQDITKAISIEDSLDYKFIEGKILYNMGRYTQAIEKLEPLSKEIQTAELYKYIGLSYADLGKDTDAAINLEKSIILSDDDNLVKNKYNELKMRIEK